MTDRYRNYQPLHRRKQPHRRRWPLIVAAFVVLGLARASWAKLQPETKPPVASANNAPKPKPKVKAEPIPTPVWDELQLQLNSLIAAEAGLDVSVALTDVNTNTTANYGIRNNFAGASTTKVLTAAAYLSQVEAGQKSLKAKVGNFDAQYQLKQMINRSNNDAWQILNDAIGRQNLQAYAASQGLSSFKVADNTITASDEALLLTKLYRRELLNDAHTHLLLSYMQKTNNETMIPRAVPGGATIYHKYGELEDRLHDAAIIDYQGRPIVIVIYTKRGATDSSSYRSQAAFIRQITSIVVDTFYI